jgi:hypothetical protein
VCVVVMAGRGGLWLSYRWLTNTSLTYAVGLNTAIMQRIHVPHGFQRTLPANHSGASR